MLSRVERNKIKKAKYEQISTDIVLALLALLVIGVGLFKANMTHADKFSKNTTINHVKVDNMSIKEATKAVNQKGINQIVLQNGNLVIIRTMKPLKVTTKDIKPLLKQHGTLYTKKLNTAKDKLTKLQHKTFKYKLNDHTYKLKPAKLISRITYKNGKYHFRGTKKLEQKLIAIQRKQASASRQYAFKMPNGRKANIKNMSYGWMINVPMTQKAILKAIKSSKTTINSKKYLIGTNYSQPNLPLGYGKSNHGLGKNYVVVSLKDQELWVIKNNKTVVHLNNVVTGTVKNGDHDQTPKGVWYILYKQSPSILRGKNSDGSDYASEVQYWMPFTTDGCGLHDASWRSNWRKTAYLYDGSHGCVNIKPTEIKRVWQNVKTFEPVIVY